MNDPERFDGFGLGYSARAGGLVVQYPLRDKDRRIVRKPDGSIQYANGWPFDHRAEVLAGAELPHHQRTERALLWHDILGAA